MKLLKEEFDSFEGAYYWISGLSQAINTNFIPSGNSIEEVVSSFVNIQLSRRFNDRCGFGSANLQMIFNESQMAVWYASTSGTEVLLKYGFNQNMEFNGGSIECCLPDDRVGGSHYETLTQFIYDYKWTKDGEVAVPPKLKSINSEGTEFPTPNWVLEEQANCRASCNPEERDAQLREYGYFPLEAVGFSGAWKSILPGSFCRYIVLSKKHGLNNYFILKEHCSVENNYSVSYKRLLEILESHHSKQSTAAEIEEPDYDESGYTEVDYQ